MYAPGTRIHVESLYSSDDGVLVRISLGGEYVIRSDYDGSLYAFDPDAWDVSAA